MFHQQEGYRPIVRLPANAVGRDFVMGDLHGELDQLRQRLAEVEFDTSQDRLFSVGDLIDRGPESLACLRLLREPWFYSVMGNHEQMMDDYLHYEGKGFWLKNGGDWHFKLSEAERHELLDLSLLSKKLPCIYIVGEGEQRFQIVHAAVPSSDESLERIWVADYVAVTLWERVQARFYLKWLACNGLITGSRLPLTLVEVESKQFHKPVEAGTSLTFCGHTNVARPGLHYSNYYLDTGCGYKDGMLTLLQVDEPLRQYRHFLATQPAEQEPILARFQ